MLSLTCLRNWAGDVLLDVVSNSDSLHAIHQGPVNAFGISSVALVVSDVRLDPLGIHEPNGVPEFLELSSPILGATACFHADQALAAVDEMLKQLGSLYLHVVDLSGLRVAAVNLKNRLGDIDADDVREVAKMIKIWHEGLL